MTDDELTSLTDGPKEPLPEPASALLGMSKNISKRIEKSQQDLLEKSRAQGGATT